MTELIKNGANNHKPIKLIVQIPAYNEEETISRVIKNIPKSISNVSSVKILVADDGSVDDTIEKAKQAGASYILRSKVNQGLGKNFKRAIDASLKLGADIIVNIDADGQFNPEDMVKLIQPILKKEADMVTASRFIDFSKTKNMPFLKKWGNKRYAKLISRITGQKFSDVSCGFRAYSREAALRLNLRGSFTYTQEVLLDLVEKGMKIREVSVPVIYHKERKSMLSGNLRRYGFKTLGIIGKTTRDNSPLTFFGFPGLILFLLGFAGGLFSLIFWLVYHVTTPVRMLMFVSAFLMITGAGLIILALVADMMKSIKLTQEEILYRLKKGEFESNYLTFP